MIKRIQPRVRTMIGVCLVLFTGAISACRPAEPPPVPLEDLDPVTLQLSWFHSTGFIGYYVAQEKGYYQQEGLNVTLTEGGPGITTPEILADQTADFVVLSATQHRNLLLDDKPAVALMAPFQISPRVFYSLEELNIVRPHEMVGRKVGITSNGWRNRIYQTLEKVEVPTSGIIEVEVSSEQVQKGAALLEEGVADVLTGFVNDEVVKAELDGYTVNKIFPADYDVGLYTGLLVAHQNILDTRSNEVERFMAATLRGWQFAVECNQEAAQIMLKWESEGSLSADWDQAQRLSFYEKSILALVPLIDTGQVPIGWIDDKRWQREMGAAYITGPGYTTSYVTSSANLRCQA
ncbi:MAG: ABC transporter substrate-binding protein [Chloroflexota bacterium]